MRRNNPTIFLGDLARAIHELGITDSSDIALIAELLGMRVGVLSSDVARTPHDARTVKMDDLLESLIEEEEVTNEIDDEREIIPLEIESSPSDNAEWLPDIAPLPPPAAEDPSIFPALEPLLLPQWTRGILSAALSTEGEDGAPDIDKLIDILVQGRTVSSLPSLPSRTLSRGLHLLVDKSRAMMPFARDQSWLQKEIRKVVGEDKVEVFRFTGCPTRGAGPGPKPWPRYQPPLPGVPVVLLTDLGICQPPLATDSADEWEWLEFAARIRRAGCPFLALVPYGEIRWPRALARTLNIIHWDRSTTASTVARLLKNTAIQRSL